MKTGFRQFSRRGFSLIEMIAVLAMLTVLILLIAATLWGAVKIERADAAAFHRMTVQAQLADRFREDVHHAVECPDSFKELSAGPSCLILKMNENRYVVYRWIELRLTRTEFTEAAETTLQLPVGGDRIAAQFGRSVADERLVWLQLLESRGVSSSRRVWPVEIRAASGGDVR